MLGVGFSALGVAAGIKSLIDAQVQMQRIDFTLQAATGSTKAAADAFEFVKKESQ